MVRVRRRSLGLLFVALVSGEAFGEVTSTRTVAVSDRFFSAAAPTWVQRFGDDQIVVGGPGGGVLLEDDAREPSRLGSRALYPWYGAWAATGRGCVLVAAPQAVGPRLTPRGELSRAHRPKLRCAGRAWERATAWIRGVRDDAWAERAPVGEFERMRVFLDTSAVRNAAKSLARDGVALSDLARVFVGEHGELIAFDKAITVCDRRGCDQRRIDTSLTQVLECGSSFVVLSGHREAFTVRGVAVQLAAVPQDESPLACFRGNVLSVKYPDTGDATPWFVRSLDDGSLRATGHVEGSPEVIAEGAVSRRCFALATTTEGARPPAVWHVCADGPSW
jgi:hypothetical protein